MWTKIRDLVSRGAEALGISVPELPDVTGTLDEAGAAVQSAAQTVTDTANGAVESATGAATGGAATVTESAARAAETVKPQ